MTTSAAENEPDLEETCPRDSSVSPLRFEFAGRTDDGLCRTRNEDSLLVCPEAGLAVIADGMGGRPCGRVASELAVNTLADYLRHDPLEDVGVPPFRVALPEDTLSIDQRRLVTAIQQANDRMFEQGPALADRHGTMATTVVAALVSRGGETLTIAHVGDSRCYQIRDDRIVQLTRDHTLVNELAARAPMFAHQVFRHVPRKLLTRALGLERRVSVDFFSNATRPGDVYVLCSDGLWASLAPERIRELVRSAPDLGEAAARLVACARDSGGVDNITVALIRVDRATPPRFSGFAMRAEPPEPPAEDADPEVDLGWED